MKLLLDENLPKKLKNDFPLHEVFTVREVKWNGIKNGELLKLMAENNFNAFISFDQNIQHQQNFENSFLTVFILIAPINTYTVLQPLCNTVNEYLSRENLPAGIVHIQETR